MVAVQQLDAHLALELGDALRDRRLGGVQPRRRAAEAAELHDPEEGFDRAKVRHWKHIPDR
jgi:hypothetical protein